MYDGLCFPDKCSMTGPLEQLVCCCAQSMTLWMYMISASGDCHDARVSMNNRICAASRVLDNKRVVHSPRFSLHSFSHLATGIYLLVVGVSRAPCIIPMLNHPPMYRWYYRDTHTVRSQEFVYEE
jgi:hypothetical protein